MPEIYVATEATHQTLTEQADYTNRASDSRAEALPLSKQEGGGGKGTVWMNKNDSEENKTELCDFCGTKLLTTFTPATKVYSC